MRTVEAEGTGFNLGQAGAAPDAGKLFGEDQLFFFCSFFPGLPEHLQHTFTFAQCGLHRLGYPAQFRIWTYNDAVNHQLNVVPLLFV